MVLRLARANVLEDLEVFARELQPRVAGVVDGRGRQRPIGALLVRCRLAVIVRGLLVARRVVRAAAAGIGTPVTRRGRPAIKLRDVVARLQINFGQFLDLILHALLVHGVALARVLQLDLEFGHRLLQLHNVGLRRFELSR